MHELNIPAKTERLYEAQAFAENLMEEAGFSPRMKNSISLVIEEIFVNIAAHAYSPAEGDVLIRLGLEDKNSVVLEFEDKGKPYNPLEEESPDVGMPAEQRDIGGLGIFLYRSIMDEVEYKYENGKNILTLKKREER